MRRLHLAVHLQLNHRLKTGADRRILVERISHLNHGLHRGQVNIDMDGMVLPIGDHNVLTGVHQTVLYVGFPLVVRRELLLRKITV